MYSHINSRLRICKQVAHRFYKIRFLEKVEYSLCWIVCGGAVYVWYEHIHAFEKNDKSICEQLMFIFCVCDCWTAKRLACILSPKNKGWCYGNHHNHFKSDHQVDVATAISSTMNHSLKQTSGYGHRLWTEMSRSRPPAHFKIPNICSSEVCL